MRTICPPFSTSAGGVSGSAAICVPRLDEEAFSSSLAAAGFVDLPESLATGGAGGAGRTRRGLDGFSAVCRFSAGVSAVAGGVGGTILGAAGMAADSGVLGFGATAAFGSSGFGVSTAGVSGAATFGAGGGAAFGISVSATGGCVGSGTAARGAGSAVAGVSASVADAVAGGVIFGAGGTFTGGGVMSDGTTEVFGDSGFSAAGFSGAGIDRVTGGAGAAGAAAGGFGLGAGAFFGTRAVCGRSCGEGFGCGPFRLRGSIARERGMTEGGGRSRPLSTAAPPDADPDLSRDAGR
jgi:hypothetical protein